MEKPVLLITTLKNGDQLTYPKKGNHVRIHFETYVRVEDYSEEAKWGEN